MTREEIKELLPIMQAWAEGNIIQFRKKGTVEWVDYHEDDLRLSSLYHYRIKPEPKYRPFETQEECWNEMHKHPDFGWVKRNVTGEYMQVIRIYGYKTGLIFNVSCNTPAYYSPQMMLSNYTFTDGTPFGIKEE